jgi:hypothetical protein
MRVPDVGFALGRAAAEKRSNADAERKAAFEIDDVRLGVDAQ